MTGRLRLGEQRSRPQEVRRVRRRAQALVHLRRSPEHLDRLDRLAAVQVGVPEQPQRIGLECSLRTDFLLEQRQRRLLVHDRLLTVVALQRRLTDRLQDMRHLNIFVAEQPPRDSQRIGKIVRRQVRFPPVHVRRPKPDQHRFYALVLVGRTLAR